MKNYVSLMVVLSLGACAAGGAGPDDRFRVSSSSKFLYATESAAESNKAITPMNSEVIVCNGTCPAHINRITGTPSHARISVTQQGGTELTIYDLSDVTFTMSDEGFDPGEESFKFVIDNQQDSPNRGKIIGIDADFASDDSFPENENPVLVRKNNTTVFEGFVNDPDDNTDPDKWKPATYTYKSFGSDKLRFSDFGTITIKRTDVADKTWTPVFIGGYDDAKKINPADINTNQNSETLTFTGAAAGSVVAILAGQGSGTSIDLNDNSAKLTLTVNKADVNNPVVTSTIEAEFNNWYDVVYTEDGTSKNIELSNYQGNETFKMLTADTDGTVTITDTGIKSDMRYFGDNGTPSEAVGIIQVRDCNGAVCDNDYGTSSDPNPEVRMNLGFGVLKD